MVGSGAKGGASRSRLPGLRPPLSRLPGWAGRGCCGVRSSIELLPEQLQAFGQAHKLGVADFQIRPLEQRLFTVLHVAQVMGPRRFRTSSIARMLRVMSRSPFVTPNLHRVHQPQARMKPGLEERRGADAHRLLPLLASPAFGDLRRWDRCRVRRPMG